MITDFYLRQWRLCLQSLAGNWRGLCRTRVQEPVLKGALVFPCWLLPWQRQLAQGCRGFPEGPRNLDPSSFKRSVIQFYWEINTQGEINRLLSAAWIISLQPLAQDILVSSITAHTGLSRAGVLSLFLQWTKCARVGKPVGSVVRIMCFKWIKKSIGLQTESIVLTWDYQSIS